MKRERRRTPKTQATPPAAAPRTSHGATVVRGGPTLLRQRSGKVVAGVAVGIADHLSVSVLWVRAVFAVMASFGGVGIIAYALLWMFVPQSAEKRKPATTQERQQGFGLLVLGIGLAVAVFSVSTLPTWLTAPVAVVLVGGAVVWREADDSQRLRWRRGARSGMAGALLGGAGRGPLVRVLAGTALVVMGIVAFLAGNATLGDLQFTFVALLASLVGLAVLTVPWWMRLVRDLNVERAARIRTQERAEIAAHLHDSVLQTLALIQKQAESPREVGRLARGQERELRTWLYGADGYGRNGSVDAAPEQVLAETLAARLAVLCGEIEDTFAIKVQQVVVGDCELDERLAAQLAAGREALVNAAKHAGVGEVSVYAEVETERVAVYVRDRGTGFDPDGVPDDRHGLADSIRGRMERNGGQVRVRTSPGAGTEVQLEMPREAGKREGGVR